MVGNDRKGDGEDRTYGGGWEKEMEEGQYDPLVEGMELEHCMHETVLLTVL